jgi:hypothetical protein
MGGGLLLMRIAGNGQLSGFSQNQRLGQAAAGRAPPGPAPVPGPLYLILSGKPRQIFYDNIPIEPAV